MSEKIITMHVKIPEALRFKLKEFMMHNHIKTYRELLEKLTE